MQLYLLLYADDTQIYDYCVPVEVCALQQRMTACIDKVAEWMRVDRLQLNATNTEVLWCASPRQQSKLPDTRFFLSVLTSSHQSEVLMYVILVFSLIATCPCTLTSQRQWPTASQLFGKSGDQLSSLYCCLSSLR